MRENFIEVGKRIAAARSRVSAAGPAAGKGAARAAGPDIGAATADAGGDSVSGAGSEMTLLAVTKTVPASRVLEAVHLGHHDFAENYVQELVTKAAELEALGVALGSVDARWHFIGHLQTNKVKALLPLISSLHTLDSEKLAREVAKRWGALARPAPLPVFIEVNIDREESKSGVLPDEVATLAQVIGRELASELRLEGLMCVPAAADSEAARASFRRLRELELACRPWTHGQLSMGMSGDFEVAIEEGATHVRVGSALFGKRSPPPFG